jgi:hypothetical protein
VILDDAFVASDDELMSDRSLHLKLSPNLCKDDAGDLFHEPSRVCRRRDRGYPCRDAQDAQTSPPENTRRTASHSSRNLFRCLKCRARSPGIYSANNWHWCTCPCRRVRLPFAGG